MKIRDPTTVEEWDDFDSIVTTWRESWGISKGIPSLEVLIEGLLSKSLSKEWLRSFIVFVVSCLIQSNKGKYLNFRIMCALHDVTDIREYDWCTYTKYSLLESIKYWFKKPNSRFDGPI